ncbi:beta-N-acetylhexosaminidase [uncultured Capnocytophaga sp.]|jgi:beta-L-N-acetylhexosaminidase|uniref:beta-N-acetylhexosaminidase n=1 Tax=uncultured Capnocytophaga sp. TaxID=159273 RepID=UPI0026201FD2|nr:beta-N-acetylhexosaminidase [uncultured Capnocytophaga sp.]
MKIYYIFLLLLFVVLPLSAQVNVIPQPNKIEYHKGSCPLKTPITYITDNSIPSKEGYELIVQPKKIILKFSSKAGKFYAEQTLAQLIFQAEQESKKVLPCLSIIDAPRFSYRALMIDPARHYWKVEDIKKYIDVMAQYKLNYLHLHLNDDQGWRIEIKKYPKLTEVGAKRTDFEGSKRNNEGYYTQEEMKSLVAYGLERNVQLVPEFDMPGHNDATVAAYPFLSCNDTIITVRTTSGVSKNLLCVGKEKVFSFIDDVITELSTIFPCTYFHIGGDEAPMDKWQESKEVRTLKNKENLKDDSQLMSYFFEKVNTSLLKNGKQPLIWMELDVPVYPKNSIMYLWRINTTKQVLERAKKDNFKLICSPGEYAYFDYPQAKDDLPNVNWMPTLPLEKVLLFNPGFNLSKEEEKQYILGVEATLWGESVKDLFRAFYMTYPRALALAEAGWTEMQERDPQNFKRKLDFQLRFLLHRGINYRPPVELYR